MTKMTVTRLQKRVESQRKRIATQQKRLEEARKVIRKLAERCRDPWLQLEAARFLGK